jgi:hypothetical protein
LVKAKFTPHTSIVARAAASERSRIRPP